MCPDGHVIPLGSYECRAASARYARSTDTRADLLSDATARYLAAIDEALDAADEIEREAPGSMRVARLHLVDARSEVEAMP